LPIVQYRSIDRAVKKIVLWLAEVSLGLGGECAENLWSERAPEAHAGRPEAAN
jgi:hypothetical protein